MTEMENDQRTDPMARVFPKVFLLSFPRNHCNLWCPDHQVHFPQVWGFRKRSEVWRHLRSPAQHYQRKNLRLSLVLVPLACGKFCKQNDFKYVTKFQLCRWSQRFRWYIVSAFLPCHVFVQPFSRFFKTSYKCYKFIHMSVLTIQILGMEIKQRHIITQRKLYFGWKVTLTTFSHFKSQVRARLVPHYKVADISRHARWVG